MAISVTNHSLKETRERNGFDTGKATLAGAHVAVIRLLSWY